MKEITKEQYDTAVKLINGYAKQEYDKLPYRIGVIQGGGRKYMEAHQDKVTGDVYALFKQTKDSNFNDTQFLFVENKKSKESFEERKPYNE